MKSRKPKKGNNKLYEKLLQCDRCGYEYYIPKGGRCPNCGWPV